MIARLIGGALRRLAPGAAGAPSGGAARERRRKRSPDAAPHPAARRLAEAIDVALERNQWERADRLARDAARIMHTSPRLTERIARLRLAQGRAEAALSIIESAQMESASLRLLRAACLIELGRVAEAHLDLREWSRKSTAPMEARRLLALLESGSDVSPGMKGDRKAAMAALLHNLRQIEDPRTLELLVIDAIAEGSEEQAERWAQRLLLSSRWSDDENAQSIEPAMLLETLGLDAAKIDRNAPAARAQQIETLAIEMIGTPGIKQVMPALIRAQEVSPNVRAASLIYEAGRRALDMRHEASRHQGIEASRDRALDASMPHASMPNASMPWCLVMCEALTRLAMLLDKRDEAIHWAQRGTEINPMSASLARLAHELAPPPDGPGLPDAIQAPARRKAA